MPHNIRRQMPIPGPGIEVYWSFAAERQKVYRRRLDGSCAALTKDPIIANHRFTNVYRASDRVSQHLIGSVIYDRPRSWLDTFVRVLVFKVFNRLDTWLHIESSIGEVDAAALLAGAIDEALASRATERPIYSAAYIMPPPRNEVGPKFRRHLNLLRLMVRQSAHEKIAAASSMKEAYEVLLGYESLGPFLALQYLIDLNYSDHLRFSERDFVVAGPGALRGMRKCITDPGDLNEADVIRWVMDQQVEAFSRRELEWTDLWGRPLQLVDIQNIFCEVDKYTRVSNPELSSVVAGKRIKQRYDPARQPLTAWFPPKWGINATAEAELSSWTGPPQRELFPLTEPGSGRPSAC